MSVLVIGQHYWGHAHELRGAKKNFRTQGGKLSLGYNIVEFGPGLTFEGVDQMGRVSWTGTGEPTVGEVAAWKGRK